MQKMTFVSTCATDLLKQMNLGLAITAAILAMLLLAGCHTDHPAYIGHGGPQGVHHNPTLKHFTPVEKQRYAQEWEDDSGSRNDDGPPPAPPITPSTIPSSQPRQGQQ